MIGCVGGGKARKSTYRGLMKVVLEGQSKED